MYCVKELIWYANDGNPYQTWTCTDTDCSNCEGDYCSIFTLTVSTEEDVSDLSPVSNCKYGDTVKFERTDGYNFLLIEIAIVRKRGNLYSVLLYILWCTYIMDVVLVREPT